MHRLSTNIIIRDILDHETDIFVWFSDCHLKTRPFDYRTCLDHLDTELVWYSDSCCIGKTEIRSIASCKRKKGISTTPEMFSKLRNKLLFIAISSP